MPKYYAASLQNIQSSFKLVLFGVFSLFLFLLLATPIFAVGDLSSWTYQTIGNINGSDGGDYADWNGDGIKDMCVAAEEGHKAACYVMNGTSSTEVVVIDFGTGSGPEDVGIGDVTKDGKADLAFFNQTSRQVGFSYCTDNMNPATCTRVNLTTAPYKVHNGFVYDIDNDGNLDIVYASSGSGKQELVWLENPYPGNVKIPSKWKKRTIRIGNGQAWGFGAGGANNTLGLFDVNNDGKKHLVVSERYANQLTFYEKPANPITQTWPAQSVTLNVGVEPKHVSLADLDGDSDLDVALSSESGQVQVWRNDGGFEFTQYVIDSVTIPMGVGLHKLEGPGDTDYELVANEYNQDATSNVYVYKMNTLDNWTRFTATNQNMAGDDIFFDDLNLDGYDDILATWDGATSGQAYILVRN